VAKGGGNYGYFFGKLKSPDWIAPLHKKGRFSHPPAAIIEETSIRFPGWPEGEYLVRMAPLAPEAVFGAIDVSVYESDNQHVHQVLLRIAAELPVALAAQVALEEAKWAAQQRRFLGLYEHKAVPVILNLAAGGCTDVALTLLKPMIHVEAAPQRTDDSPMRGIGTPLSRIESWNIQRLLLQISQTLTETCPEDFLTLLSEKLDAAVAIYVNERGNGDDYSLIWRPRVASGRFGDLMDTLVSATRDAAGQIVQRGEKGYEIVLRVFGKHGWRIFRRLEYYALSQAQNLPIEFVRGVVSQDSLYQDQQGNPEFNDFVSKVALHLPDETRNKLLAIVDAGPDLSKYSKFLDAQGDNREVAERRIVEEWRLGWLTVLNNIAGEERLKHVGELLEKYGPPRPAFSFGGVRAIGHTSDITQAALRKLSIPDLIAYLKKWAPPPRTLPEGPSRAGIGHELHSWVSEDPALFSDNLASFHSLELHPTYLRSVLDALTGALKGECPFDPYNVATTIEWVLSSTSKVGDEHYEWDEDPGWSWAHMSSARFLAELFLHPERLDTARHSEFWPALILIAENPSPTEKDETEYRNNTDFGTLALNSTRPVGLQAVMRYARWLKQSAKDTRVNAECLPEPFKLLAAHLHPEIDNSVAVRETYGMQFGLLAWLDQRWWEEHLPELFPEQGKLRDLDRFAWNSYLRFSRPIVALLAAMRFRYERAINALQLNATEVSDGERSLGNHFMQYYAAGAIQLGDALLTSFFAKASPALKAQTIGDVGWQLGQEGTGELDAAIRTRLMELWESRLAKGMEQVNASKQELGGFGWWFASKKFPDDWSIHQLVAVLETFRNISPDFAVVKRLEQLVQTYPYESVRCLGIIFEEDREGWSIHGWADSAQMIVREALKGNEQSRAEADRVVNLLVARGHHGFRTAY
jgi:hypothetical protein